MTREVMKPGTNYFLLLFFLMTAITFSQSPKIQILGVVTDRDKPLADASIVIKGTTKGVVTNAVGKYAIEATPKDVLIFTHVGMKSLEIIVEDVTTTLNIEMTPNIEALDEVVVTKYKRKTQTDLARTFYSDPTIIKSNFGYLNPQVVGYELRVIDGKDLNTKAIDILHAIAEQLPGVTIRIKKGEKYLFTSSVGSLRGTAPVVFEIDGQLWPPSKLYSGPPSPTHLDIESILRIGIVPGDQAMRLYGGVAAGGMVVINTNQIGYGEREAGNKPYDQAKLRGNVYANDAVSQKAMHANHPIYLRDLYQSSNVMEAKKVYEKHKKNFGDSYVFKLEAYRFFQERFGDIAITNKVLSDFEMRFEENPLALKALAYIHQSNGDFERANGLYKEVFLLRPDYGQSYLDLGNSYREIKEHKKAASLYTRYNHLIGSELIKKDSSQFFEIFDRDFSNLVMLKGNEIISDKAFERQSFEQEFQGIRLVFEWNDGEAEFELQFVNPQGHYLKEEHSLFANAAEIQQEKVLGYSSKEFLMDDSLTGTWQVNATYLGNRKLTASYLKAIIYYDYGLETQRKETKVFKLWLKNVNQKLFKITIEASSSTK